MSPLFSTATLTTFVQTLITQCLVLYGMHNSISVGTSNPPSPRLNGIPFPNHGPTSHPWVRTWNQAQRLVHSPEFYAVPSPKTTVQAVPLTFLQDHLKTIKSHKDLLRVFSKRHNGNDFQHHDAASSSGRITRSASHWGHHRSETVKYKDHVSDYEKLAYIYDNQPSFLDEVPEEHLAKMFENEISAPMEQYQADEPDDADLEAFEAALHHIEEMNSCSAARCKEPQPFVQFMYDQNNRNRVFMPQCTILHRCMNFTGCCGDSSRECVPKKTNIIHRAFLVMELLSGKEDYVTYNPSMATMIALVNHTECECREKPRFKPCTKGCPIPFGLMQVGEDCICNCSTSVYEDHWQCEGVKEGVVPLSQEGLICIKEGKCYNPECSVGKFVVKSGFCPLSDLYSLKAYMFENPEDRRYYRKHLQNFDFFYKADIAPRVYIRHKDGKISPHQSFPVRGVSKEEKEKRLREKRIQILSKTRHPNKKHSMLQTKKTMGQIIVKSIPKPNYLSERGLKPHSHNIKKPSAKRRKKYKNPKFGGSFSSKDFLRGKVGNKNSHYNHRRRSFSRSGKPFEKIKSKDVPTYSSPKTTVSLESQTVNNLNRRTVMPRMTTTSTTEHTTVENLRQAIKPTAASTQKDSTEDRGVIIQSSSTSTSSLNLSSSKSTSSWNLSSTSTSSLNLSSWLHDETPRPLNSSYTKTSSSLHNQTISSYSPDNEILTTPTSAQTTFSSSEHASTHPSPQPGKSKAKITPNAINKRRKMQDGDKDGAHYDEIEFSLRDDSTPEGSGADYEN